MAENKIQLRIVTPRGVKVDEKTDMIIVRCIDGDMGFLPNREACATVLNDGVLRMFDDSGERIIAVFGGLAQMQSNTLTVLTPEAQWPEEIDLARAEADREQLEERLRAKEETTAIQTDQVLLRRSLVRIEVSSYPLINKTKWKG